MSQRSATIYRMKLPDHECPYGLLARRMLDDAGFEVEEHLLTTREEVDAFEDEQQVATTPIIFIDGDASTAASNSRLIWRPWTPDADTMAGSG